MPRAYSRDLRERLVAALDAGLSPIEIQRTTGINERTVRRWRHQQQTTGDLTPRRPPGRPRTVTPVHDDRLRGQVQAHPDWTLAQHAATFTNATTLRISPATICRRFAAFGFSLKKKSLSALERDPAARRAWWKTMIHEDHRHLLFLDETSTPTTLTPLRARAPRGTRAPGRTPHRHWSNVTLLATLTPGGMGESVVIDGATNRQVFDAFITQRLAPRLRRGQIVVMDNLSVHHSAIARAAIEAAGCQLVYLPAYSPDFNPIEQAFAKIKQALRRKLFLELQKLLEQRPRARLTHCLDDQLKFTARLVHAQTPPKFDQFTVAGRKAKQSAGPFNYPTNLAVAPNGALLEKVETAVHHCLGL